MHVHQQNVRPGDPRAGDRGGRCKFRLRITDDLDRYSLVREMVQKLEFMHGAAVCRIERADDIEVDDTQGFGSGLFHMKCIFWVPYKVPPQEAPIAAI